MIAPLYFVVFVLMAQFVLVNVVVAVLMKHLEESHKQMDEDEDHEIDLEIAKEIAAEKKALIEAIERRRREADLKVRRPLMKMASLPSNFTFYCSTSTTTINEGGNKEDNLSQWPNQSMAASTAGRSERIELAYINREHKEPEHSKLTRHHTVECSGTGNPQLPIKSSATCDSIFLRNQEKSQPTHRLTCEPTGSILKKSHSLRVRTSRTGFIDSFKRSSLYRKNQADGKSLNGKSRRREDEVAFLGRSDDEDDAGDESHSHISKSSDAIVQHSFDRSNSGRRKGGIGPRTASRSGSNRDIKCNPKIPQKLTFKDAEVVNSSSTVQSPVTIRIDDCHNVDTFEEIPIDHEIRQETIDQRPQQQPAPPPPCICDLLSTTVTPTTTASPSRHGLNGSKHRKLSDFLDEESAPLSPGLYQMYPEFNTDVATFADDDLNVLDEEEAAGGNEQLSLASMESWPSASADLPSESGCNLCEQSPK